MSAMTWCEAFGTMKPRLFEMVVESQEETATANTMQARS